MAAKKTLTDEELFAQFEDIPSSTPDVASSKGKPSGKPSTKSSKPAPSQPAADDDDPLAELSALAAAKQTISRPHTPLASSTTSGTTGPKMATPASSGPPSGRNSEDRDTPSAQPSLGSSADTVKASDAENKSSGGGWWGSVFTAASAAVKQAEAAAKQIRSNEEAMKWAEQVRGNVDALRAYGKC